MNSNTICGNDSPPIVTSKLSQCVKSICASRPGGCFCSKYTSRSGPLSARQSLNRLCKVRRCVALNRPGCRSSSHSSSTVACNFSLASLRSSGTISSSHTPVNASGRVRQLRFFFSDGNGPLRHLRAPLALIPAAAADACCVLPSIILRLSSSTC